MPIAPNSGFQNNLKTAELTYASGPELRQLLEKYLYSDWNDHVLQTGLPLEDNSLVASYRVKGQAFPAVFLGNPPDSVKPDATGVEIVVNPDPQIRATSQAYRVLRWYLTILDRSPTQDRIEVVQVLLQNLFRSDVYYVPRTDAINSNLAYHNGLLMIDITAHRPAITARTGRK